jgi:hypothetical protein
MFDVDLPDPLGTLEAVLEGTASELLLASEAGVVLASSNGLARLLGVTPAALAPGTALPDLSSLAAGRAGMRRIPMRGRCVAYLFRRASAGQEAADSLRHENTALRETLDAVDGTIVVYDNDLRYVFANRAYHEFFPHLPGDGELAGRHYGEIAAMSLKAGRGMAPVPEDQREAFIAQRIAAMQSRPVEPREVFDRRPGRWFLIRVRWTPSGHRVALRVDIDDQKHLQKELLWEREAAVAATRANLETMARTGNAMRAPLQALAGLVGGHTTNPAAARRAMLELMALADRLSAGGGERALRTDSAEHKQGQGSALDPQGAVRPLDPAS